MSAPITTNDIEHEVKVDVDEYYNDGKTKVTDAQQPCPVETTGSSED